MVIFRGFLPVSLFHNSAYFLHACVPFINLFVGCKISHLFTRKWSNKLDYNSFIQPVFLDQLVEGTKRGIVTGHRKYFRQKKNRKA